MECDRPIDLRANPTNVNEAGKGKGCAEALSWAHLEDLVDADLSYNEHSIPMTNVNGSADAQIISSEIEDLEKRLADAKARLKIAEGRISRASIDGMRPLVDANLMNYS